jgi:hypothetical protein
MTELTAFEHARRHIKAGTMPTGQEKSGPDSCAVFMEIGSVLECEVDFANERGHCSEGCELQCLIDHPSAGLVCRWTMQPCKPLEAFEVIKLYSLLNAERTTGIFLTKEATNG